MTGYPTILTAEEAAQIRKQRRDAQAERLAGALRLAFPSVMAETDEANTIAHALLDALASEGLALLDRRKL